MYRPKINSFCKSIAPVVVGFLLIGMLTGCSAQSYVSGDENFPNLAIEGFNYTDRPIDIFYINGTGGGNLSVSTETSGGGGTTCCFQFFPRLAFKSPVEIEWARSINGKYRWCKKNVVMTGPIPKNPTDLGIHFMPDGNIIVQPTEGYPLMKLSLSSYSSSQRRLTGNEIHDEERSVCSNEQ